MALTRIGRYQIVGELGRGAMGVVYHATDPSIGRSVAIKTIRISDHTDLVHRQKLRERLFREARSAGVLSHPNIVTIYDMDEVDGFAWIAMAHVKGPTLERILDSSEALPGVQLLRLLRQVAAALDYAHSRGVVHRDIKPANIMADEDGVVKITDFGIAKITGANATETRTIVGTPNYMSPEQVQGHPVDGRSDQFSLAVIAYEILTGERPFQGEQLSNIVYKIVAEKPIPPSTINASLTPAIDQVLSRALAKNPSERYDTCMAFVAALEMACAESRGWKPLAPGISSSLPTVTLPKGRPANKFLAETDTETAPVTPPPPPPAPAHKSIFLPIFLSVLVLLGVAAAIAWQAGLIPDNVAAEAQDAVHDAFSSPNTAPTPQRVLEAPANLDPPAPKPSPLQPPDNTPAPVPQPEPPPVTPQASVQQAVGSAQDVWVSTNPAGAKVVLDDRLDQACQAPCMLHSPQGVHHLTVSQAGFQNEYREIHVGTTAQDVPVINLRQPGGTLMVSSEPPGANVRINGQLQTQQTPASIPLRPGTYTVTVERAGRSQSQRVEIQDSPVLLRVPIGQ